MTSQKILTLRAESYKGELPAFAWPGGYPIIYFCDDGGIVCPTCADMFVREADKWSSEIVAYDVYWEGDDIPCEHCYRSIESAYGPVPE